LASIEPFTWMVNSYFKDCDRFSVMCCRFTGWLESQM
jgi:hypothetical protein